MKTYLDFDYWLHTKTRPIYLCTALAFFFFQWYIFLCERTALKNTIEPNIKPSMLSDISQINLRRKQGLDIRFLFAFGKIPHHKKNRLTFKTKQLLCYSLFPILFQNFKRRFSHIKLRNSIVKGYGGIGAQKIWL